MPPHCFLAVSAVLTLTLAGCGDGRDDATRPTGSSAAASEPLEAPSPTFSPADDAPATRATPPTLDPKAPLPDPARSDMPPPPASPAPPPAPPALAADDKGEKGARAVLLTWARALENRQFATAWTQFRSPPAGRDAFVRWWQRYATLTVAVPSGEMDAGAGSLYYTAPATITGTTRQGKPFRLEGEVVLRRVNDVDGATADQLRWHIAQADLKSVPVR